MAPRNWTWPGDRRYFAAAGERISEALSTLSKLRKEKYGHVDWIVSHRIKSDESIQTKLRNKQQGVQSLTDILGIRAIVPDLRTATGLARSVKERALLDLEGEIYVDDFIAIGRPDGYRGIHVIAEKYIKIEHNVSIPFELQIRTILQHKWSEDSHRDVYKHTGTPIPPCHLQRIKAFSECLYLAELESEDLRRSRILDLAHESVMKLMRLQVLEDLNSTGDEARARDIGTLGNTLIEFDAQLRRAALWNESTQEAAAILALHSLAAELSSMAPAMTERLRPIVDEVSRHIAPLRGSD